MQVNQIMTREAEIVDPNRPIEVVARLMRADNLGALPVGENDRLVGMITDRDIVVRAVAEGRPGGSTTVRDVMSEGVCYCYEDDDIERAAEVMAEHQIRRLPVLNREKRLVGIVALADLARAHAEAEKIALEGICEPSLEPRRPR
jgi:CBS domain-containing protein